VSNSYCCISGGNIRSEVFGSVLGMATSLIEIFSRLGLCPLTGWLIVMVLFEKPTSIHRNLKASPGSANVSLRV